MATARKLPSGSWRCQIYDYTDDKGKRHYRSFTAKTKKEAEYLATTYKIDNNSNNKNELDISLKNAMYKYCDMKSNVLSPTTLTEYKHLINNAFKERHNVPIKKINVEFIQLWVNEYSIGRSPKTVKNAYGFLYVVLKAFLPNLHVSVTLPQRIKPKLYVPTDDDIKAIIDYLKDNDIDLLRAVYLAAFGTLRRSEICALTSADVEKNIIHINKALVLNEQRVWVVKTTKTVSSIRDVDMPNYIINLLPKSGNLVNLNPNQITHRFAKILKTLNIQSFRFHDLRHYAASMMHALGVPDVYIMQRGGWASDSTLKSIYRGVMNDYKEKFTNKVFEHLENMQHEISHKK
jgi:integrase family protein